MVFCSVTGDPLYRTLPPRAGNTQRMRHNCFYSSSGRRQWYHFLISWLDEACAGGRARARFYSGAHWPRKDAVSEASPPSYSRTSFFLWFWAQLASTESSGCFLWIHCFGAHKSRLQITFMALNSLLTRLFMHSQLACLSLVVCEVEQLNLQKRLWPD